MSKEKVAQDSEGFSDGLQRPESQHGSTYVSSHLEDAVFGEVSEGGPNYRNVCLAFTRPETFSPETNFEQLAWMDCDSCTHDQDPDWPGCSLHSCNL